MNLSFIIKPSKILFFHSNSTTSHIRDNIVVPLIYNLGTNAHMHKWTSPFDTCREYGGVISDVYNKYIFLLS